MKLKTPTFIPLCKEGVGESDDAHQKTGLAPGPRDDARIRLAAHEFTEDIGVDEWATAQGGYRSFDILHIATALHLGATDFLTFDVNQKKLAEAEGLVVPI